MFPDGIRLLAVAGNRVFAGSPSRSVVVLEASGAPAPTLRVIADDPFPRLLVSMTPLDADTVVCSDKFGNLFVVTLSPAAVPATLHMGRGLSLWSTPYLGARAAAKVRTCYPHAPARAPTSTRICKLQQLAACLPYLAFLLPRVSTPVCEHPCVNTRVSTPVCRRLCRDRAAVCSFYEWLGVFLFATCSSKARCSTT